LFTGLTDRGSKLRSYIRETHRFVPIMSPFRSAIAFEEVNERHAGHVGVGR